MFILDTIQGAKTISVQRLTNDEKDNPQPKSVELSPGASLQSDDLIETGPNVSVRVIYPDGSVVVVGRSSKFYVVSIPAKQSRKELYGGELVNGQIRSIVRRSGVVNVNMRKRYRFVIKTKSAVMGVRGTDFVVEAPGENPIELHSFYGQVDLGVNSKNIMKESGKPGVDFVTVNRNQFVSVLSGQASLPTPKEFDPEQYAQKLNTQQPDMNMLAEKALPDQFLNEGSVSPGQTETQSGAGKKSDNYYINKAQQAIEGAIKAEQQKLDKAGGR